MTRRRAYGTIIKTALAEMQKRLDAADNTTNQSERRQLFLKARNCAAKVLESEERLSSLNGSKPLWKQYQARKSIMDELRSLTDRMPWDERPYWTTKLPGDEYYGALDIRRWVPEDMNLLACTRIELLDLLGPTAVERHRVRWLWEIIDSTVRDAMEIGLIYEDENGRRYCDPERCEPGMYREMHTAIRVLAAQSREGWGPKSSFADRSSGRARRTVTSLQAFVRVFAHRIEQPDYVQWCEYLAWLASRNEVRRVKK